MRDRTPKALVALAALVPAGIAGGIAGGCDSSANQDWQHETLWAEGSDRIELDRRTEVTTRDTMVSYRVRLVRGGDPVMVLDGVSKLPDFTTAAGRLGDGRVALLAHTVACTTDPGGKPICVDLGDVGGEGRSPLSCEDVLKATARCRSALDPPDASLSGVLRWVAASPQARAPLRVAAVVALARGGEVPDGVTGPLEAAVAPSDPSFLWLEGALARAHRDPVRGTALRHKLADGSQVERVVVAESCVPELAADVAAVRGAVASTEPKLAAQLGRAEKACAALPPLRR